MEQKLAIAAELQRIADLGGGRLTPEQVVEAAADPDNPLHQCFTWDDEKAAAQRRIDEARRLIRSVRVQVRTETTVVRTVAYTRDPDAAPKVQGYVSVARLRNDKDAAREAVVAEFHRAAQALRRAREIAAALGMAGEIQAVEQRVASLLTDVQEPAAGHA